MSRCKSCDNILQDYEIGKKTTIFLSEEETMEVDEEFCNNCLSTYVYGASDLETVDYCNGHISEDILLMLGINTTNNNQY